MRLSAFKLTFKLTLLHQSSWGWGGVWGRLLKDQSQEPKIPGEASSHGLRNHISTGDGHSGLGEGSRPLQWEYLKLQWIKTFQRMRAAEGFRKVGYLFLLPIPSSAGMGQGRFQVNRDGKEHILSKIPLK